MWVQIWESKLYRIYVRIYYLGGDFPWRNLRLQREDSYQINSAQGICVHSTLSVLPFHVGANTIISACPWALLTGRGMG